MLENGINIDTLQRNMSFLTYESHVPFALRFMIDCGLSGGTWVELKAGTYQVFRLLITHFAGACFCTNALWGKHFR